MKKFFTFLVILLPWFLSSILFKSDPNFYNSLNLPFYAPPTWVFPVVWIIIYILIAISVYLVIKDYKDIKSYYKALLINYITNQLYTFFFFTLKSPFLGFVDTLLIVISSIHLYSETKKLNDKSAKFLVPYIIWSIFASFLSLSIYFMNF